MIAVDTSVWIDFFRGRSPVAEKLTLLLDRDEVALPIPVRSELLLGARALERPRLGRLLSALPVLYPTDASWNRIEDWVTTRAVRGHRFGFADLLVAALAADHDCALWSLDADFARMVRIGIVRRATL